jgi:hypothetical protein
VKPAPRWGPLPWFVLVLTLLLVLLVALLPPLILDETPPAWVLRNAARVSSWHGDPEPIEAEWVETTRAEAERVMEATATGLEPEPAPSGTSATATATAAPTPQPTASAVEEPGRAVQLVVMRGRFESAPPGGPPPPDAPERWLVVAYDAVTHERWRLAVLTVAADLPDDSASFEF